jgi:CDGSH-type Zn-finger protein/uncharacterized Fe-S cluster protein YjdI
VISAGFFAFYARRYQDYVQQGEGSIVCKETSHYARFRTIREQWQALSAQRAAFTPYRNAARHPVMRSPMDRAHRVQVVCEPAINLLDVGNASYFLMLRIFSLMSDPHNCLLPRPVVMAQAMSLMHALADIGAALTALPANPAHPGVMAGLSFTLSRTALGYESPDSAARLIAERMLLPADHADTCAAALPSLARLAASLREAAGAWRRVHEGKGGAPAAQGEAPPVPAQAPADANPNGREIVRGETGTIYFDARRCVHSRHCVLEEPKVLKANQPGAWIFPDSATPERLARVARNFVSGAISYERHDGVDAEIAPPVNLVRICENGPLALNGAIRIVPAHGGASEALRAALCRCGQSKNKPYCDGSHIEAGFVASGEAVSGPSPQLEQRNGPVEVTPLRNGPLDLRGAAEIITGTGHTVDRTMGVRLCRCGHSGDKPFCDGSHRAAGFGPRAAGVIAT